MPAFSAFLGTALLFFIALAPAHALPRHAPVPGGVAVLPIDTGHPSGVRFGERPQALVRDGGRWYALVGIPLDTPVGRHTIRIDDGERMRSADFEVVAKRYPEQRLTLRDPRMVTPPPELAARLETEAARLTELKTHYSAQAIADTRLSLPADGRLSSRFGLRRVLNGEPRSPHPGLDLAVGVGSPVFAPAGGTVLAVEDLYFAGQTVVIDHGQGLITLHAHLSASAVRPGEAVRRGQRIGSSGASGRATGPHLHWGVFLGGTAVDPELFLGYVKNERRPAGAK